MFTTLQGLLVAALLLPAMATIVPAGHPPSTLTIQNDNPLIYYHGRWDASPGTWWCVAQYEDCFCFWYEYP